MVSWNLLKNATLPPGYIPTSSPFNDKGTTEVATFKDNTNGKLYKFPFNVNSLQWNYNLNTKSFSTIGGRVTQILSVQITTIIVQGEAGSRKNLMQLYEDFKLMQDNQNNLKVAPTFHVPSRGLMWNVWLEQMQLGWDVTTVTYPYYISLEVDQDLNGNATNKSAANALDYIVNNNGGEIGFSTQWTGLA